MTTTTNRLPSVPRSPTQVRTIVIVSNSDLCDEPLVRIGAFSAFRELMVDNANSDVLNASFPPVDVLSWLFMVLFSIFPVIIKKYIKTHIGGTKVKLVINYYAVC